jgi:methanogenic corrinoid protein MtbC1
VPAAPSKSVDLHVPVYLVRFVTSTALFDEHDAAINIMRRILQAQGAEVVHLGHDRRRGEQRASGESNGPFLVTVI